MIFRDRRGRINKDYFPEFIPAEPSRFILPNHIFYKMRKKYQIFKPETQGTKHLALPSKKLSNFPAMRSALRKIKNSPRSEAPARRQDFKRLHYDAKGGARVGKQPALISGTPRG